MGARRQGGRYANPAPPPRRDDVAMLGLWWQFMTGKRPTTRPQRPFPSQSLSPAELATAPEGRLYRLGHSTLLMRLDGAWWLTDPVFGERASPLSWLGPRRFQAPAIALAQLPALRGVILSHDHYDHLDKASIRALAARSEWFIAPLGVGELLRRWGVAPARIVELDWWQAWRLRGVELTATPAQHFSGRSPWDRNKRLWASWAIQAPAAKLFFGGDGGYFDGFAEIGRRLGPFDLSLLECGAYDRRWDDIHMLPEQTVQAHLDLGARCLLPIHNGTFDLAFHDWHEPMERVVAAAQQRGVALAMPMFGQPVDVAAPPPLQAWWRPSTDAAAAGRLTAAAGTSR